MNELDLNNLEIHNVIGTGADYEVRLAGPIGDTPNMVMKRPNPHSILKNLHASTETRTHKMIQFHKEIGNDITGITHILGYFQNTPQNNHLYTDELDHDYTVVCQERASGIPLNADVRARILKVPTGLGQTLFALFPLGLDEPFDIPCKLMDIQNDLYQHGYLLFDLNPQNVFYSPDTGNLNMIDTADLHKLDAENDIKTSNKTKEDYFLELIRYYVAAEEIPTEESAYFSPRGDKPYINKESEINLLKSQFEQLTTSDSHTMLDIIKKIQSEYYQSVSDFNQDMMEYFSVAKGRLQLAREKPETLASWHSAKEYLHHSHWSKYDFNPNYDKSTDNLEI